jgi:hypothetical protein
MMRVRYELIAATVFVVLAVTTFIWPTWIESLFGASPDAGNGESERGIVYVFGAVAIAALVLAARDYRVAVRPAGPASDPSS